MPVESFLVSTEIIDWQTPAIRELAAKLTAECANPIDLAKTTFEWVRDEIKHSSDHRLNPVTCRASDVLAAGTGYCYAKSHLLAALLRANGIPTGLCYQRLSVDGLGPPYCLHGLNAVLLPEMGWYRVDARGNRADIHTEFTPPIERLAFPTHLAGEYDLPQIYAEPLSVAVDALQKYKTWETLLANLPDAPSAE